MASPPVETGQRLPTYRVIARNAATLSDNKIHSDEGARFHGFRGGLVPGITTFGYMTRPVVEALGLAWIDHGSAAIRLRKPVYEGEEIEVLGLCTAVNEEGVTVELTLLGEGETKATGTAALFLGPPPAIDLCAWPRTPLPVALKTASRPSLEDAFALGSVDLHLDAADSAMSDIDDAPPIFRKAAIAHPALLLGGANAIFAANVALGPWIHLSSEVLLYGRAREADAISVRGRIDRLFEKKGRELVDLDVLVVVNDERAVMRVKHTAMYRL
jgi:acyl dehydratase